MARETGIEPATARLGKPAFYFRDFCYFSGREGLTPNPINLSNLAIPDHVATGGCGKSASVTSGAVFCAVEALQDDLSSTILSAHRNTHCGVSKPERTSCVSR